MKLLIIDDHAPTRALISTWVCNIVTQVREASNGLDGLAECAAFGPDIVTLDLRMRVMDGFETLRRIRSAYPQLPVVIVSQTDYPSLRARTAELGAAFFVCKEELRMLRWYLEREVHKTLAGQKQAGQEQDSHVSSQS